MTLREDRHRTQPWGLHGGRAAPKARATITRAQGQSEEIPSKGMFSLFAGDCVCCWASGGAGYGDPLQRDPQAVKQDIVDGKISAEAAREEYGVVLADSDVDLAATQTRRDGLRAKLGPINWTYDRGEQGRT